MQKYFLAIVPEGEFQDRVKQLKLEIKDRFQAKFALKSPAHITLKMPFVYNEAKEDELIRKLGEFIAGYNSFNVTVAGLGNFGTRVIYLDVEGEDALYVLQRELISYFKRTLKLTDELSDRNFQPHMTVAFKDIKRSQFQNILAVVGKQEFQEVISVSKIVVLKKVLGQWEAINFLELR
ncbi:2'-5' RNA ligase family protein [Algoriphagus sp.]|uniref:2'-5' RNA ligase family protein n=1 Tax=Algoriphagus sp. TaxID=1872435 RepID=UPI00326DFE48